MTNWAALVICPVVPLSYVGLNLVLVPSNATFNVWAVPAPTPVKLTGSPGPESAESFIVFLSTNIT